jgi:alcohol dehydrogenase
MKGQQLSDREAQETLVTLLQDWTQRLEMPRLSAYGVTEAGLERIVANSRGSSMKTNPIALSDEEIATIVRARL